jgi:hypothetical protein
MTSKFALSAQQSCLTISYRESGYTQPFSANYGLTLTNDNIVRHWDMHGAASLVADFAIRDEHRACWLSVISSSDGSRIARGVSIWDVRTCQSTTTRTSTRENPRSRQDDDKRVTSAAAGEPYSGWAYRDSTNQIAIANTTGVLDCFNAQTFLAAYENGTINPDIGGACVAISSSKSVVSHVSLGSYHGISARRPELVNSGILIN